MLVPRRPRARQVIGLVLAAGLLLAGGAWLWHGRAHRAPAAPAGAILVEAPLPAASA